MSGAWGSVSLPARLATFVNVFEFRLPNCRSHRYLLTDTPVRTIRERLLVLG